MANIDVHKSAIPPLNTLIELLAFFTGNIGNHKQFTVYDMGRQIIEISIEDFKRFERTEIPWPTPLLQSAWFTLIFTDKKLFDNNAGQYHLWFLKFPLDEQGKLVQATRDEYIAQFLQQINDNNLSIEESKKIESPYGFKPSEEKLANINAIYKVKNKLQASHYFQPVVKYFEQTLNTAPRFRSDHKQWHNWKTLGYQGIADFCSRLDQHTEKNQTLSTLLLNAFTCLPLPVISSLSTSLEHHALKKNIYSLWLKHLDHKQLDAQINTLKVISLNAHSKLQYEYIKKSLQGPFASNIEILAIISGRNWLYLQEPELMLLYLEALARNTDSEKNFNILLQDLLFIPGMREHVLLQFRNPERSAQLSQAIGNLYSMAR
ncbi:MAG: DUF3549 family protein [Gammaproteobacteria bacterium]|nr:DUF3549 family protein [Gammaproteobacteria bacterium]